MKASELRIGNWLHLGKSEVQVFNITYNRRWGHCINHPDIPVSEFEPIPLTAEWLLNFGFKKKENDYFMGYNLPLISGKFSIELERCFVFMDRTIVARCKYVHQLQNFYFAVTWEELTIKQTEQVK